MANYNGPRRPLRRINRSLVERRDVYAGCEVYLPPKKLGSFEGELRRLPKRHEIQIFNRLFGYGGERIKLDLPISPHPPHPPISPHISLHLPRRAQRVRGALHHPQRLHHGGGGVHTSQHAHMHTHVPVHMHMRMRMRMLMHMHMHMHMTQAHMHTGTEAHMHA